MFEMYFMVTRELQRENGQLTKDGRSSVEGFEVPMQYIHENLQIPPNWKAQLENSPKTDFKTPEVMDH